MNELSLKNKIYDYALNSLGFDDCRFTDLKIDKEMEFYKKWLDKDYHGDMDYLKKHLRFKENPRLLLEEAQSAVVVIKNYKNTKEKRLKNNLKIARYAAGKDYHSVVEERLKGLTSFIQSENPDSQCYCSIDSQPVAERALALKTGVGFLGKNSMVIKPGLGSYFFIGVILTNISFEADQPLKWNCGECRLCIDACPTQAILNNQTVDAVKCISYQTIEKKTPMTDEELSQAKGWLFGCDICQEVCPYNNASTPLTDWIEFLPKSGVGFDFLDKVSTEGRVPLIPKHTALYRSRRRVVPNVLRTFKILNGNRKP